MKLRLLILLVVPFVATAQDMPGIDPSQLPAGVDLQALMQQAQKMSACMADIDQDELARVQAEAESIGARIEALCADGKADEALEVAVAFGREMQDEPVVQEAQGCVSDLQQLIPALSLATLQAEAESGRYDVCSVMQK